MGCDSRAWQVAGVVFLLGLLSAPLSPASEAARPEPGAGTAPGSVSPAVSAAFSRTQEICRDIARIRGRPFKRDVAVRVQSLDDFRGYLQKSIAEQLGAQNLRDYTLALIKVGLLEKDIELDRVLTRLMESQAMAHYDPQTGTYYLLKTNMPAQMLDLTSSHELCHAMQDQYHDVKAFLYSDPAAARDNGDAAGARTCVTEGEATLVMMQWQFMNQLGRSDPKSVDAMVSAGLRMQATLDVETLFGLAMTQAPGLELGGMDLEDSIQELRETPRFILQSVMVPYLQGALMVDRVRQGRGWEGVDDLFRNPPQSTEQVLHPEKLPGAEKDPPVDVRLPGLTNSLPAGWRLAEEDVAGELGIRVYLEIWQDSKARDPALAAEAAAGWGGDRYYYCVGSQTNQDLLVWKSVWDTGEDAVEFEMAYRVALHQRFPGLKKAGRGRIGPGGDRGGHFQMWEVTPGRFLKLIGIDRAVGIVDSTDRRLLDQMWKDGF